MSKKAKTPVPSNGSETFAKITRAISARPRTWLALLTLACLLPFINKGVHIDDTLFLRAAEHIQKHPADFYGFTINWFGVPMPMIKAFDNPPLTSFYIAAAAGFFGWSEPALHLAFLLPALAAVLGTYTLARNYCQRPLLAAVVAVLTPVFLVSATTLMCDVTLLAFWVWSLEFFERGLRTRNWKYFLAAGLLAGLGVITKFPALALVPLMAAYAIYKERRPGPWIIATVCPLLFAAAYEFITGRLYGSGLMSEAFKYASGIRSTLGTGLWERGLTGLVFTGGCLLPVLFYAPLTWTRRETLFALGGLAVCLVALPLTGRFNELILPSETSPLNWGLLAQAALFMATGIHVLTLAILDFSRRRDAVSLMLLLWVGGIFVFATCFNWTTSARSILPMTPAVAILVARRMESEKQPKFDDRALIWPAALAAALTLLVVRADYNTAASDRAVAKQLFARYARPDRDVWFAGHWGFQYYMEKLGAKPVDESHAAFRRGDIIIVPHNSTNGRNPDLASVTLLEHLEFKPNNLLTLYNRPVGAGFYASVLGPLPYAAGKMGPDVFEVFEVTF